MIVTPIVEIDMPRRMFGLGSSPRWHNQFVKAALRRALFNHWRRNMGRHFEPGNAERYHHAPRYQPYLERKRRQKGHQIDLLFSGRTKRRLAQRTPTIHIGGAAEGGKRAISAWYNVRMPFRGGTGRSRRAKRAGVSIAQMLRELTTWAADEREQAVREFHDGYWKLVYSVHTGRLRLRGKRANVRSHKARNFAAFLK